jgi:hypothetical protein
LKRVLIVSPHFPPNNMADVHRVRQSLPHYGEFGWEPVVLAVDPDFVEANRDELLLRTVPDDVEVLRVRALDSAWTRKVGLGSLALRSLPYLRAAGDLLLKNGHFDLVYFSTTQFPVLVLGRYWKRRFGIPYVVDMQDPWHSDYYLTRPQSERPPKFWFSDNLNRMLEPVVMKGADGLIAVTGAYIDNLNKRYPDAPFIEHTREIPFGVAERDFEVARSADIPLTFLPQRQDGELLGVYTGVCNSAMEPVLRLLFRALRRGIETQPELYSRVRLAFVGTNYAHGDRARPVVTPIAEEEGIEDCITERAHRVPYMAALKAQLESDFLLLPGTRDAAYTASKIYPYLFTRRPVLAIFHEQSTVIQRMKESGADAPVTFKTPEDEGIESELLNRWTDILKRLPYDPAIDADTINRFSARTMTARQVELFEDVLKR